MLHKRGGHTTATPEATAVAAAAADDTLVAAPATVAEAAALSAATLAEVEDAALPMLAARPLNMPSTFCGTHRYQRQQTAMWTCQGF